MKSTLSRISSLRWVGILLFRILIFLVALIIFGFYFRPLRNFVLSPVWPKAWRQIGSTDVFFMTRHFEITEVKDIEICHRVTKTNVTIDKVGMTHQYSKSTSKVVIKDKDHHLFLPIQNDRMKRQMLYLYLVLAEALKNAGIVHFFVEGSLLGVVRHGGFVPWDDDLDIAISVRDWKRSQAALSCIHGYRLSTTKFMHWKFHPESGRYPFIDLFFYNENESVLWAITPYITTSVAFALADVFPLTTASFENLMVPVPGRTERATRHIFDLDVCQSPSLNHQTGQKLRVLRIPCASIGYLYDMRY